MVGRERRQGHRALEPVADSEVTRPAAEPQRRSERIHIHPTTDQRTLRSSLQRPRQQSASARLELCEIGKSYGPVIALDGVNLMVEPGELLFRSPDPAGP